MNTFTDHGNMRDGNNMGGQPKISDDYRIILTFNAAAQGDEELTEHIRTVTHILIQDFKRTAAQVLDHFDEIDVADETTIFVQRYHEAMDLVALANERIDRNFPGVRTPEHLTFRLL